MTKDQMPPLPPIERDENMDRTYIPLPGGWEVQTKGKGSTFRIAHVPSERRYLVLDEDLHKPLEQMALAAHHHAAQQPATVGAVTDEEIEAIWARAVEQFQRHERGVSVHPSIYLARALLSQQGERGDVASPAYGIIDPDYARYYSIIRCTAWSYGYAIGMHGSFTRDLDLIMVPWTDEARDPAHVVKVIVSRTDLRQQHDEPGVKPHGRRVWTLHLPSFGDPRWIDLSVMPRIEKEPTQPTQALPQQERMEGGT